MEDIRESLAQYAHEAWAAYMEYFLSKWEKGANDAYLRSIRALIATSYAKLSEPQKELDRTEADKILAIVRTQAEVKPKVEIYSRPECPFVYCDSPVVCELQLHGACRHRPEGG